MKKNIVKIISCVLCVILLSGCFPVNAMASTEIEAYTVGWLVGKYSFQTDTSGNAFFTIDGKKYYCSKDMELNDGLEGSLKLENQNLVYELHNNEIVKAYSMDEVLYPKITLESSEKDGIIYHNGKFNKKQFDIIINISCGLEGYFKKYGLLDNLSEAEKQCLYIPLKKIRIDASNDVNFGSSGLWIWKEYTHDLEDTLSDNIIVGDSPRKYTYGVNLNDDFVRNMGKYDINFSVSLGYETDKSIKKDGRVSIGNLDYQEEQAVSKKQTSTAGSSVKQASTQLDGLKNAMQFSQNIFTSDQTKQINNLVNIWVSDLILAKYADKSDLDSYISKKFDEICNKWLKKLGLDESVLAVPGVIRATAYLKTQTKEGDDVLIQFNIELINFEFNKDNKPTMATGSGNAIVYDMDGVEIDRSVILPVFVDICAFCEQIQKVAKDTIFNGAGVSLNIFGISAESTAEALSSRIMEKILNGKYTKNAFKVINAKDVQKVLNKIIVEGEKKTNQLVFKLVTTPEQGSTLTTIKCPVDVTVYDPSGRICGQIINNTVNSEYGDVFTSVDGDQKNVYLIGDDYSFELTGTDTGTMNYIITEFDENGNITRKISYENVALTSGCKYYAYVSESDCSRSSLFNLVDAEGNDIVPTSESNFNSDTEIDDDSMSGSCGENVYWKLDKDGTLRIYGNGEMYNYSRYDYSSYDYKYMIRPWESNITDVKRVYVEEGVLAVGSYALGNCTNLSEINLAESVLEIGNSAFLNCSNLEKVNIPKHIDKIEDYVFSGCSKLEDSSILDGIKTIGRYAFSGCIGLRNIPNTWESIGKYAFLGCENLENVPHGINSYEIAEDAFKDTPCEGKIGGCGWHTCWQYDKGKLTIFGNGLMKDYKTSYYDIKPLPPYECYGDEITEIIVEHGVQSIGEGAFAEYKNVEKVQLSDTVTDIREYAFGQLSSLTNVILPVGLKYIGDKAFDRCIELKEITIPDEVTSIGKEAFKQCKNLQKVLLGKKIKEIGVGAFYNCESITNIIIPDEVTSIGGGAFGACSSLKSITMHEGLACIGNGAFASCTGLTKVDIPKGITRIEDSTFEGCNNLTSVVIPNSVTSIGQSAFVCCTNLINVVIPDSVTSIGQGAFGGCTNLINAMIPDSVTSIGSSAFENCSGLTSVTISDSVTSIGSSVFENCSGLTSVTIPDSVTSIGSSAFKNCSGLTSVTISDSVMSIGSSAFENCSGLTSVMIPDSVTSIEYFTFKGCDGLTSVTIPDSVARIGSDAFANCSRLTSVTIPNSVTSIGSCAFWNCSSLTSVTIPNSVTNIGSAAFKNCSGLTSVTISDSVTSIGSSVFENCSGLTSVMIPDSVTSIDNYTFKGCDRLTNVTILPNVTSIGADAFSYCNNLTIVCSPNSYAEEYAKLNGIKYSNGKPSAEDKDLSTATVMFSNESFAYNGHSQKPEVTAVMLDGEIVSTDKYAVYIKSKSDETESDGINAGIVTLTVEAKDGSGYVGSVNKTYIIAKADASITLGNLSQMEGSVVPVTAILSPASSDAEANVEYLITKNDGTKIWTMEVPQEYGSYEVRAFLSKEKAGNNLNGYSSFEAAKEKGKYAEGTLVINKTSFTGGSENTGSGNAGSGSGNVGGGASGSQSQGGSIGSNQEKPSGDSANKVNTETVTNPDGSTTTVTNETKEDGTIVRTEEITKKDGTKKTSVTETKADGTTKVITTAFDVTGKTASVVEKTILQTLGKGKDAVITVKRNGNGKVTSSKSSVNIFGKNGKATIDGDIVKELVDVSGTDTDITMTVKDNNGDTLYKLTANSGDLEIGNSMKVFKYSTKKGYVLVNTKSYRVSDSGDVSISLKDKATYRLEDTKTATKIEKQILASIKPAKSSVKVKNGKSIKVALAETFNKENAKSITFSTIDKKILNVSKNGIVKALTKGSTEVRAKVVLKNGKTKTVKIKVTVN